MRVKVMFLCMYVISPPCLCSLSVLSGVELGMCGVL